MLTTYYDVDYVRDFTTTKGVVGCQVISLDFFQ
jgi:hypothetical protein